ncbi:MAG: AAA family ATPase, partial [Bacillota bacterium]
MRLRYLRIAGFRGFNVERYIALDNGLTVIYGPNSYGKTSICEAIEWLVYGHVSRVEAAPSNEEFSGCYRNVHLADKDIAYVEAGIMGADGEITLRAELDSQGNCRRFVNGSPVNEWPFPIPPSPRPFVFQHGLKDLILTTPDRRFQHFAVLLGLSDLERFHRDIIALCTKPQASVPADLQEVMGFVDEIRRRLRGTKELPILANAFERGPASVDEVIAAAAVEAKRRLAPETPETAVYESLRQLRAQIVSKVFPGRITLTGYSEPERSQLRELHNTLLDLTSHQLVRDAADFTALATATEIRKKLQFLNLGINLWQQSPEVCPFCGQQITEDAKAAILKTRDDMASSSRAIQQLEDKRQYVLGLVNQVDRVLEEISHYHLSKAERFITELRPSLSDLQALFTPENVECYDSARRALEGIGCTLLRLKQARNAVKDALSAVRGTLEECRDAAPHLVQLGEMAGSYVTVSSQLTDEVAKWVQPMAYVSGALQRVLDERAGTQEITLLLDIFQNRTPIRASLEMKRVLEELSELRKTVDQYVARTIWEQLEQGLTQDVLDWYQKIRTQGDPDVHFDGFNIDRTKKGDLKARKLKIRAKSYGKDLVSAASSLSESKLNALGLCISIASNLASDNPFGFLVIDDPVQSWDADHEAQFVQVVRALAERGKQIILLSHSRGWLDQVRMGCRSLGGRMYEIAGYAAEGPIIRECDWAPYEERLREATAIVNNAGSSTVQLQMAEEELRLAVCQIACTLYQQETGKTKNPNNLNSKRVREMLASCGVPLDLVDRICQTFATTDDAHHTPARYTPNRERIRCYIGWAHDLAKLIK